MACRNGDALMVSLPCRDIHVCGGKYPCQFLEPTDRRLHSLQV